MTTLTDREQFVMAEVLKRTTFPNLSVGPSPIPQRIGLTLAKEDEWKTIASVAGFTDGGVVRNARKAFNNAKKKLNIAPEAGQGGRKGSKASPKRKLG